MRDLVSQFKVNEKKYKAGHSINSINPINIDPEKRKLNTQTKRSFEAKIRKITK